MKRKQYISPEISVYSLRPQCLLQTSVDPVVSSQSIQEEYEEEDEGRKKNIGW